MRKIVLVLMVAMIAVPALAQRAPKVADGKNEILAVVDGEPITYQQIAGRLDLAAEIRTVREVRRVPDSITDAEIERELVYSQLEIFIVRRLLTAEAERVGHNVSDSEVRSVITRERAQHGIAEGDEVAWAAFLQQKYGQTPSEYRERKREDVRQNQLLYLMAGWQGPLPTAFPISVSLPLSVTPREIRAVFEKERERYKVATNIDYQVVKLVFPRTTVLEDRRKLVAVLTEAHGRARRGEGLEAATAGLKSLVSQMSVAGLKLTVGERMVATDDSKLGALDYRMVLSLPKEGGVSEVGAVVENDDSGAEYDGYQFIKLYSKVEGSARRFEDPKVQEAITEGLRNKKLDENISKVQAILLKRAIIVPERLIAR